MEIADDIDRSENDDQATERSDDEDNQDDEAVFMTNTPITVSSSDFQSECCTHACCYNNTLQLSQPVYPTILRKTEKFYGSIKRTFNPTWYQSHPWIHLCTSNFKVYCFYCKYVVHNLQMRAGMKPDPAFTKVGFSNWKKGVKKLKAHEASTSHNDAFIVYESSKKTPVSNLISKSFENDQLKHHKSFIKQLAALKFLLRQALPVRNDHAGGSNLTVLLDSVLEESQWLKNGKYHSPEVINELIEIMAHKVLRSLLSDISSRKWYAIMADETRDISNHEQLVLCIRSVSEDYVVHEDMIGMYRLEDITSSTIYACLKDSLVRMCLMIENCRGQA